MCVFFICGVVCEFDMNLQLIGVLGGICVDHKHLVSVLDQRDLKNFEIKKWIEMHGMRALVYSEHCLHAVLMRYARTLQGSLFKGSPIKGSLKGPHIKGSLKAPPIKGSLKGSPIKDSVKGSLRCLLHALLHAHLHALLPF